MTATTTTTTTSATSRSSNSSSSQKESAQPSLPPLYFADSSSPQQLPAELLHRCLTEYSDWGELARLACVQKSWSNVMYDSAASRPGATWVLANAMLEGQCGLAPQTESALNLFLQLANVAVREDGSPDTAASVDGALVQQQEQQQQHGTEYAARAMRKVASCYFEGQGVDADATIAVQWMEAAHAIGEDVEAAHDLALVYEHGHHGVDVDVVEAVVWFRKAAEVGHCEAMAEIGLCYELGIAVEQSDEEALDWYMKAAEKGHLTAKFSVGEAFEEARGVPQSDAEACLWYYKAAVEGDEDSRKALQRLEDIARIVLPNVGVLLDA